MDDPAKAAATYEPDWDTIVDSYDCQSEHTLEDVLLHLELALDTRDESSRWRRELTQALCGVAFQLIERFELTGVARTSDPVDLSPELINVVAGLRSEQGSLVAEALNLWKLVSTRPHGQVMDDAVERSRQLGTNLAAYLETASCVEAGRETQKPRRQRRWAGRVSMNPAYTECRRAVRVRPMDSEVLFDDPPSSELLPLVDLSTDGALLNGMPPRSVGRRVRFVLLFPQWQPMMVEARIVRATDNGGRDFAVGFEHVPQKTRRLLSDTVTTELKRALRRDNPTALVVDGSKTVCRFVCETLGEYGATSYAEGTVLDAVNRLVRGKRHVRTVFVGNPVGSSNAFEFARFVSTQFPDVRLVLLVERASRREPSPPIRRDGRVVTLLDKPWTPARLASFMLPDAWPAEV